MINLKEKFVLISKTKKIIKLVKKKINKSGRNNLGKITMRHRGGGNKKQVRIIDFSRSLWNIEGLICRFEYDPNRSSLICLVCYSIGVISYILAVENLFVGNIIINGVDTKFHKQKFGDALIIKNIFLRSKINSLESKKNGGLKLLRASGSFGKILKKNFKFCLIRLKSGFIKKIHPYSLAVLGVVFNFNYYLFTYKKAGLFRVKGKRPHVRGVAMNPIDHPHGGGEGKKSKPAISMSPWGRILKKKKNALKLKG